MRLVNYLEKISSGAAAVSAFLLIPLIGSMVFEVFSRYVLSAPTSWAYEVSYMLMAAIFVLGIAYTLKKRQHVSVDMIDPLIGRRGRAIVDLIGYCLLLPCVTWIAWTLADRAIRSYQIGETSGQSTWNPYLWPHRTAIAIGFAIFALQLVAEVIKCIQVLAGRLRDERDAKS